MASKRILQHSPLIFSLLLAIVVSLVPYSASASSLNDIPAVPDLTSFISTVKNSNPSVLSGVYVNGLFALPVLQQPVENAGFVSTLDNTVTQFNLAAKYGNVGLLAHNYLSGQYFNQLVQAQNISLVYGNGRIENFRVTHFYLYQAVSPDSLQTDFIDLNTQKVLTASAVFAKVYLGARHVTFQTCISLNGNSSWGRIFIIAEPEATLSAPARGT
jgi:hypothetical protein